MKISWAKEQLAKIEEQGFNCRVDKHICKECIGNYAIKDYIEKNANENFCDYCSTYSDDKISVHIEEVLEVIVNGIRTEWGTPGDECVGWNGSEGGWQGARVLDKWDLIRDEFFDELEIENDELLDDIVDSMNDEEWCEIDPYGLRPYEADCYTWELFCRQVKYESRYVFFKVKKDMKFWEPSHLQPFEILNTIGEAVVDLDLLVVAEVDTTFYRGRTHNHPAGYTRVSDLAPPPRAKAIYSNRMSPAGIPMFYGAFDTETATEEIRDDKNYITIGSFTNQRPLHLIDFTKVPKLPSIFDEDQRELRNAIRFLSSFVADLSKPITKDATDHIEYVPTQIVTEFFRRVFLLSDDTYVDGIIYPSSKVENGNCIVLFFENQDCTQDGDKKEFPLSLCSSSLTIKEL